MKSQLMKRIVVVVFIILTLTLGVAACTSDASLAIISPQLGSQLAAQRAGAQVVVQPTPVPPKLADLSDEEIYAGLPEEILGLMATANPDNGQALATANGCIGCHAIDPAVQMTGPTWHNMGDTAVARVPGTGPALYLYTSIVNPRAYNVPNYPNNVMPLTYADLPPQDLADLVAYLLTLHGQP